MKTGSVYINNVDIYASFGAYVTMGGYDSLVSYPPLKGVTYSDYVEKDGVDPDLEDIALDSKDVSMTFAVSGEHGRVVAFYEHLSSSPELECTFTEIGYSCTLRVRSMSSLTLAERLGRCTVTFTDDHPLEGYEYAAPSSNLPADASYQLDGRRLTDYGVRITKGTHDSLLQPAGTKELLVRSTSVKHGGTYDENPSDVYAGGKWSHSSTAHGAVKHRNRDVRLKCLLTAPSASAAMRNYNALLFDLVRKNDTADPTRRGMRTLTTPDGSIDCYYRSQSVSAFYVDEDRVWIQFELTLTTIGK